MTDLEASLEAHKRWCKLGQGIAVRYRPTLMDAQKMRTGFGETIYEVGICKDDDGMEVFGRSTESFLDALQNAEGV